LFCVACPQALQREKDREAAVAAAAEKARQEVSFCCFQSSAFFGLVLCRLLAARSLSVCSAAGLPCCSCAVCPRVGCELVAWMYRIVRMLCLIGLDGHARCVAA
jgi:hypothetical protein